MGRVGNPSRIRTGDGGSANTKQAEAPPEAPPEGEQEGAERAEGARREGTGRKGWKG